MPYRRLPNTDTARIRAMKAALKQSHKMDRSNLPFSPGILQKMEAFLPHFEMAIQNQRKAFSDQAKSSKKYGEQLKKARLYISHFIQVLNFTIIRGEMKPDVREFYGIDPEDKTVPSLVSEKDLVDLGDRIIKGEQERTMKGGNPIYSPSIALVRVNFENFKQAYNYQKVLQNNSQRFSERVAELRMQANEIILTIWDEVEESFMDLPDRIRRMQCEEYGLVYVFRRGEKERLRKLEEAERRSLKLPFSSPVEEENQIKGQ